MRSYASRRCNPLGRALREQGHEVRLIPARGMPTGAAVGAKATFRENNLLCRSQVQPGQLFFAQQSLSHLLAVRDLGAQNCEQLLANFGLLAQQRN